MKCRFLAALFCTAAAFALAAQAQPTVPSKVAAKKTGDRADPEFKGNAKDLVADSAARQAQFQRQFVNFTQKLAILAGRLENGTDKDKEKAKALRAALRLTSERGVEGRFEAMIRELRSPGAEGRNEVLSQVLKDNKELRDDLKKLIALLTMDESAARKEAKERMARLLEQLKELIAKQERVRALTEMGRKTAPDLKKDQNKVTKETAGLIKGNKKGDKEVAKGERKDAGKSGEAKGEGKNDTKDAKGDGKGEKGAEGKPGSGKEGKGGEGKDGKAGEGKDGKEGDGKSGEGKEGKEGKPGSGKEGKEGEGKDGKAGEGKGGEGKDGKSGEGKEGKGGDGKEGKAGEGKDGKGGDGKEGKPGSGKEGKDGKAGEGKEGKGGDGKPGSGKEGKPGDGKPGSKPGEGKPSGKPGEGKPGSGKPSGGKPGDGKAGDKPGKPGEAKSGTDSKGKGEGKGDAKGGKPGEKKAGSSGGKPGDGSGKPGGSKGGGKGSGKPGQGKSGGSSGGSSGGDQNKPDDNPVKKQIEDANKYQKQAETELDKEKKDRAVDNQDKAIKELEAAKKKLEDLLKQMREEELERLLAALEQRCRYMLALQIEVRDSTVTLDKVIQTRPKAQPSTADVHTSQKLSDKEDLIVREADAGLKLLEDEGSAVAFAEVFRQVRDDMKTVKNRLGKVDTGKVTVTIENDIIETLKEMIEALKKAQKDLKNPPKPPKPSSGMPPPQQLIDLLAELKMIYAMQRRVNARTEVYGKQYKGEQAPPPETGSTPKERDHYKMIQDELKDLSKRQDKIRKVTKDIATGKNEAK